MSSHWPIFVPHCGRPRVCISVYVLVSSCTDRKPGELQQIATAGEVLRLTSGQENHTVRDMNLRIETPGRRLFVFPQIYCTVRFENADSNCAATDLPKCSRWRLCGSRFGASWGTVSTPVISGSVFGVSVVGVLCTKTPDAIYLCSLRFTAQ